MFKVWRPEYPDKEFTNGVSRCMDTEISRRILNPGVRGYLRKLFPKVMRSCRGVRSLSWVCRLIIFICLIVIPPKYGVSAVIGQMKQYTARKWGESFRVGGKFIGRSGCLVARIFVSTVGLNEKQIIAYVKWQAHSGFRSSEAWIVLKSATGYAVGIYTGPQRGAIWNIELHLSPPPKALIPVSWITTRTGWPNACKGEAVLVRIP